VIADKEESPFREREPIEHQAGEELLLTGELEVLGRMPWSSNATFLCDITPAASDDDTIADDTIPDADGDGGDSKPGDIEPVCQAIYKPHRGEQPLWDFPSGLYKREVAMYRLSEALGWGLIPPTVLRDGPAGIGSLQLFIPTDFEEHYFTLRDDTEHRAAFQKMCALDFVANSTDRKAGHCLLSRDGRIYGIDNGLSFHAEFKLRTVLWDFSGDRIPKNILTDLGALTEAGLPDDLKELLDPFEVDATITRAQALIADGRFPTDPSGRRFPWPLV